MTQGRVNRRGFMMGAAAAAVASGSAFRDLLSAPSAFGHAKDRGRSGWPVGESPWGPLRPVADQHGVEHIALPPGFSYTTLRATGDLMSDGSPTPQHLDGMHAFPGPRGTVRLVRNHEVSASRGTTGVAFPVVAPESVKYDATAKGGSVTLDYDPATGAVRDFVSLAGTIYNCSGGTTLDGRSWISAEETTHGTHRSFAKDHGYCFVVPKDADGPVRAVPLKAMGRFNHEAAVADPRTGIVYLTEDRFGSACGFYRFLPEDPYDLAAGGKLQMLAIAGRDRYDCRKGQTVGLSMRVRWVDIPEPDAGFDDPGDFSAGFPGTMRLGQVAGQGFERGAAAFDRLEGAYASADGSIFFVSTSGGDAAQPDPSAFLDRFGDDAVYHPGYGQIWELDARANGGDGNLRLVYESPGADVLDSPDNLTFTPRGGIVLCEDDTAWTDGDAHPLASGIVNPNRLVGMAKDRRPFDLAVQLVPQAPDAAKGNSTGNEFAGTCFSPDGRILFVNLYGNSEAGSGRTLAITGPWHKGGL